MPNAERERDPNYNERSTLVQQIVNESESDLVKEAQKALLGDLLESIKLLKDMRFSEDESVSLNAIKHHLKLAGLEKERTEHSGNVQFQPFIIGESLDEVSAQDG